MRRYQTFKKTLKQRLELINAAAHFGIAHTNPDFICIGAPRSGTTWLSSVINRHPGFCRTNRKEMHFFDEPIYQTIDGKQTDVNASFYGRYFDMDNSVHWRWYSMQFRHCPNKIKGDITPAYSRLSDSRVKLIAEKLQNIKLIYMIRNPIERAWSGVRYFAPNNLGKSVDDMSINEIMDFLMIPRRLIGGNYADVINRWEQYFPISNFHYVFYDDLSSEPHGEAVKVCQFLDADPKLLGSADDYKKRVNASINEKAMPEEVFTALSNYYREQINFLSQRFERNFDHWLINPND